MKRLLSKVVKEAKMSAIKKVVGVDVLFSKLSSGPNKEVLGVVSEIDFISKFNEVRDLKTSAEFKADVFTQKVIG